MAQTISFKNGERTWKHRNANPPIKLTRIIVSHKLARARRSTSGSDVIGCIRFLLSRGGELGSVATALIFLTSLSHLRDEVAPSLFLCDFARNRVVTRCSSKGAKTNTRRKEKLEIAASRF